MSLLTLGDHVLDAVRRRSSRVEAEAYLVSSESQSADWSEGQPENTAVAKSQGIGLRVVQEGRLGFGATNKTDSQALSELSDAAVVAAETTSADPALALPGSQPGASEADLQLEDPTLSAGSFEARARFLQTIEQNVKKRDPRLTKVLRATYREGRSASAVVSQKGIRAESRGTHVSFSLACVAVQGAETQVGYGFQAARHYADLRTDWVIERTVENALSLLGGKQVPSGRYDLLFDPFVAAEMLELLGNALRGDQVLKGRSFLAAQVGRKIASSCVTILDDALRPRGLATSAYDAEGVPARTQVLVRGGVLEGFLYDSLSAAKAGTVSTGSAGRSSYRGLPEPEPSNFYIQPGSAAPEELVGGITSGLYVHNVMGLHTVDTVSGDFSLGIMGERIERGRRTHGVRGVTIAGNLLELLIGVEAVGRDLVFSGSLGAPTLWVKGVSVGGA